MKKLLAASATVAIFAFTTVNSEPLAQIDEILMTGPTYAGDQWTVFFSSPVEASVTYVTTAGDTVGSNITNAANNWAAAINVHPVASTVVSATAELIPEVGAKVTLTGVQPGEAFSATVLVIENCDCDYNESAPLTVSITTVTQPRAQQDVVIDPQIGGDDVCKNRAPVVIFGSEELDVTQIDESTLLFGDDPEVPRHRKETRCSLDYVNDDIVLDLVCQYVPGTATADLSGELIDGTFIEGSGMLCATQ